MPGGDSDSVKHKGSQPLLKQDRASLSCTVAWQWGSWPASHVVSSFFHQNWSWKVETVGLNMGDDERLQPRTSWFTDTSVEGSCEHSQNQVEQ